MKTKVLFFLMTLFVALSISAQERGVEINGVRWATRNVAAPGTFTANPEDAGMFYQWNSKVGWPATGTIGHITATDGSTTWNQSWTGGYASPSKSDTWTSDNDPSPTSWRVPTYAEIETLFDPQKVISEWIILNGVYGRKITDKISRNSIFLPVSGYRYLYEGALEHEKSWGLYWSSTTDDIYIAYSLFINIYGTEPDNPDRAYGLFVRPVAK